MELIGPNGNAAALPQQRSLWSIHAAIVSDKRQSRNRGKR